MILQSAVCRFRIEEKEIYKIEKCQHLGRELEKIWNVIVEIIPLVAGSLGTIPNQFGNRLKQIGITAGTAQVLLGRQFYLEQLE